jgi:hypothetical protein
MHALLASRSFPVQKVRIAFLGPLPSSSLSPLPLTQSLDTPRSRLNLQAVSPRSQSLSPRLHSASSLISRLNFLLEMSAPPHDGWPKVGDIFPHWSDLVLATQLAALRAGYTGISKHWRLINPFSLIIRCHIEKGRLESCAQTLVKAVPEVRTDLAGSWVVESVRDENLEVGRHSRHVGGVGTSKVLGIPS